MLKQKSLGSPEGNESLPAVLKKHLERSGKSIYQLSKDSGIDAAYIWRVMNAEKREVSREVVFLLSAAIVVDERRVEKMIEVADDLLDAAGYRGLRPSRSRRQINNH